MSFRLHDEKPQYRLADGTLAAGGVIVFYVTGTTTPKNVYPTRADAAAGTNSLGYTVSLDSDGRHSEDVWLASDEAYRVDVRDSDGVSIPGYPLDDVTDAIAGGVTVLDPADGEDLQVYSTDGTPGGAYWRDVLELPDPSGHANCYLTSDGDTATWTTIPSAASYTIPEEGITQPNADSFTIGGILVQKGTGSASTNGTINVTASVTFGTAFSSTPVVIISATVAGVTSDSPSAACSAQATSVNAAGFTANFFAGAEANGGNTDITSPVSFNWIAMGAA